MKIAVLVSGGVDSSVALHRLHEQGHKLTAFYLKIWLEDELSFLGECPWEEDLTYVREACAAINVPLEIIPLQQAYHERVVRYVIQEIQAGRTPNPDLLCNQYIKFGAFYDAIKGRNFDKIATGHYAQVQEHAGIFELACAPDLIKDQTYFLAQLSQEQLASIVFPIGHMTKAEVRAEAERYNLSNKARKDSQGICFLGKLKFSEFVRHHVGDRPGKLLEFETGAVVGAHQGFWYFTIGQRQGIGLSGGPWYVVAKNSTENTVFISRNYYTADKARNAFYAGPINWLAGTEPSSLTSIEVKMRHGPQRHACSLEKTEQGNWLVQLHVNDQGIAPGQFAVFYSGDLCLGAGVILEAL